MTEPPAGSRRPAQARRIDARGTQDLADGGWRDCHAELRQFAVDPAVSRQRVLLRQANERLIADLAAQIREVAADAVPLPPSGSAAPYRQRQAPPQPAEPGYMVVSLDCFFAQHCGLSCGGLVLVREAGNLFWGARGWRCAGNCLRPAAMPLKMAADDPQHARSLVVRLAPPGGRYQQRDVRPSSPPSRTGRASGGLLLGLAAKSAQV
jgi:hypothetical protein